MYELILKRLLLAFVLTILAFDLLGIADKLFSPPPVQVTAFSGYSFLVIVGSMIGALYFGIPNVLFLLLLYVTNMGREFLINIKYLIIEVSLLCLSNFLVDSIVRILPEHIKSYHTPSEEGLRFCFFDRYLVLYSFGILLALLLLIKKVFINRKHKTAE